MKRNMDLIRLILLEIEEQAAFPIDRLTIDGYTMKEVAYHCRLLHQHGFVDDYREEYGDDELVDFGVGELTWEGHEYLDTVRDDSFWSKTKQLLLDKGIPLTLETVKAATNTLIAETIGKIIHP